ncbi:hypothetical protein [Anabaena azotica]|uniref:Uncharacterized protein n=1 Tax=Anabaena azotica FACHB-119 TaxID=947527 RepID=A0ABR8DA06_9NOST|nr:hypothetical protein [Anabaena azotica]MBD2503934.1 hypothetical protein [Anabaena azotica FACHB-119]
MVPLSEFVILLNGAWLAKNGRRTTDLEAAWSTPDYQKAQETVEMLGIDPEFIFDVIQCNDKRELKFPD